LIFTSQLPNARHANITLAHPVNTGQPHIIFECEIRT